MTSPHERPRPVQRDEHASQPLTGAPTSSTKKRATRNFGWRCWFAIGAGCRRRPGSDHWHEIEPRWLIVADLEDQDGVLAIFDVEPSLPAIGTRRCRQGYRSVAVAGAGHHRYFGVVDVGDAEGDALAVFVDDGESAGGDALGQAGAQGFEFGFEGFDALLQARVLVVVDRNVRMGFWVTGRGTSCG